MEFFSNFTLLLQIESTLYLKDDVQQQNKFIAELLNELSNLDPFRWRLLLNFNFWLTKWISPYDQPSAFALHFLFRSLGCWVASGTKLYSWKMVFEGEKLCTSEVDCLDFRRNEQNHALQTLQQMVSEGSLTTWEENFKSLILHIFNVLAVNDVTLKRSALKLLTKIW